MPYSEFKTLGKAVDFRLTAFDPVCDRPLAGSEANRTLRSV
jgi:hypothetical protein